MFARKLLKLDAKRTQWALGYAGSNAGGTWAFIPEGAMSKRVHPGLGAQTGIVAAYLVWIVWDGLRRCGIDDKIEGFGKLFRDF